MRLYIAGPMTGLPEFNYPAFFAAATALQEKGFGTINPARQADGLTWNEYMRLGITDVLAADGVALLPAWETSRGARLEHSVAAALGIPIETIEEWLA